MRGYWLIPTVVLLALACGGEVSAPTIDPLEAPVPPPTADVGVDPTKVVSGPPVGTDEASFVAKELGGAGPPVPRANELSGEMMGSEYALAADRTVRGVPCSAAFPAFVGTDHTWSCVLSAPWQSGGLTVPAGDGVTFWLGSEHAKHLPLPTSGAVTIAGVPCMNFALLNEQGALVETTLAGPHTFQNGLEVPVGAMLLLDGKGNLTWAHLMAAGTVRGKPYGDQFALTFDAAGEVTEALELLGD